MDWSKKAAFSELVPKTVIERIEMPDEERSDS